FLYAAARHRAEFLHLIGDKTSCALTWRPAVFAAALPPKNTAARFSGGGFLGIICFLKLYYIFSKISLFYIKNSV
ncbi:MAG: hypothetical protein ACLSWY_01535, partial [Ruthenibacterium lactatiformans]